jgi:(1->4)-alpha-D-glucan 1-alpha-D-glucosylmutase
MQKAVRESKVHTSWLTPNEQYENALARFVERVLTGRGGARFVPALLPFQRRIASRGMVNSLAQTTIKLGSPGVPDFYQGTELWDLSLVDPDNRRPVDFCLRRRLLDEVDALLTAAPDERGARLVGWLQSWADGRIKLAVTTAGLRLRRERPELFHQGRYVPLETAVPVRGDIVAFARVLGDAVAIVAAPRLSAPLTTDASELPIGPERWKTSRVMLPDELRGRVFRDVVTGAELRATVAEPDAWLSAGQLFQTLPTAMLISG